MCKEEEKKSRSEVNNKNRRITDRRELRKVPTVAHSYWQVGQQKQACYEEGTNGGRGRH